MSYVVKVTYPHAPQHIELLTVTDSIIEGMYDTVDIDALDCAFEENSVFVAGSELMAQEAIKIAAEYMIAEFEVIPAATRYYELQWFVDCLTEI